MTPEPMNQTPEPTKPQRALLDDAAGADIDQRAARLTLPTAQCHSCHAPIWWLTHIRTGKRAPIDTTPTAGGAIEVDALVATYRILGQWEREQLAAHLGRAPLLYTSHFQTCPHASQHRGR